MRSTSALRDLAGRAARFARPAKAKGEGDKLPINPVQPALAFVGAAGIGRWIGRCGSAESERAVAIESAGERQGPCCWWGDASTVTT